MTQGDDDMTGSIRRAAVALAVALAVAGLAGTGLVATAPPAAAALSAPSVKLAFGDSSLTVAWGAVSGATGYTVQHSTTSTFSRPVSVSAGTKTKLFVTGLTNRTTYYVRVIAVAGGTKAVSATATAVPDAGYPRLLTVSAVSAGPDAIRVSWKGQGRATKVGVVAGANSALTTLPFHSAWYPATTTSITLTVPVELRPQLGSGSGNPVYVKVATYNSLTAGSAMPIVKNEAARYRLSPSGTRAWAEHVTPSGTRLRVATYNVKSVTATAAYPGYTWRDRRRAVAASITRSGAAVVATQELNTSDAGLGTGVRQHEDLLNLLAQPAAGGYAIANTPTRETTGGDTNWAVGAHLFYRPALVTREAGGIVSPRRSLGLDWPTGLRDRYLSWARFRVNATGDRFYAVSVHLPVDAGSTSFATLRNKEIAAIDTYVSKMAGNLPVLMLGDFNSSLSKTTSGPAQVLRTRGYYDAAAAPRRAGLNYLTVNSPNQIDNLSVPGFPTRPYAFPHVAVRIDYLMTKNAPGSWGYSNQLVLTAGAFDRAYQGSDHNLQWADIGIP